MSCTVHGHRHITQLVPIQGDGKKVPTMLFVLCDDGTVWHIVVGHEWTWERVDVSSVTDVSVKS